MQKLQFTDLTRRAIPVLAVVISVLFANIQTGQAKVVSTFTGRKAVVVYGIQIDDREEIYRAKKMGIIWQPYDPVSGDLLDPILAPYLHYSQADADPDCSYFSCPTHRTVSIRYTLPPGHYVMGKLFIFSDNMGVGAYAQIEDFIGDETNVRNLNLPKIDMTEVGKTTYIGDLVFKLKFKRKTSVPVGLLSIQSTEFEYTLVDVVDGFSNLQKRLKKLYINEKSNLVKNITSLNGNQ